MKILFLIIGCILLNILNLNAQQDTRLPIQIINLNTHHKYINCSIDDINYCYNQNTLQVFDENKQEIWHYTFSDNKKIKSNIFVSNNEEYIEVIFNNKIFFFNKDGNLMWHTKLNDTINASANINNKYNIIQGAHKTYILNNQNGKIIWQKNPMKKLKVFTDNNSLFLNDHTIFNILSTGKMFTMDIENLQDYHDNFYYADHEEHQIKKYYWFHKPLIIQDKIFVSEHDQIKIFNFNLELIKVINIKLKPNKIITQENSIFLIYKNYIQVLNQDLEEQWNIEMNDVHNVQFINNYLFVINDKKIEIFHDKELIETLMLKNIHNVVFNSKKQIYIFNQY